MFELDLTTELSDEKPKFNTSFCSRWVRRVWSTCTGIIRWNRRFKYQ